MMDTEERESLRCQIPDSTADSLVEWLHGHLVRPSHVQVMLLTHCFKCYTLCLFQINALIINGQFVFKDFNGCYITKYQIMKHT